MVPNLSRSPIASSTDASLVTPSSAHVPDRYRLGDAVLTLSGDAALLDRFRTILGDCASTSTDDHLPSVVCNVDGDRVSFAYPGPPLTLDAFVEQVAGSGWQVSEDSIAIDRAIEWRGVIANCAINVALAIQRDALFFHAASFDVAGRGALLAGPKEAGKSTTSLAVAARGHRLLGDEIAAVRTRSNEVLPFPRAVSVREGIRSEWIDERLRVSPSVEERYPDGSRRLRVRVSDLFSSMSMEPVPLKVVFFLRPFGASTRIERFTPSRDQTALLEPLGSALWGDSGAARRFQLLRLISSIPCYYLAPGSPDETARAIEEMMEAA
jgi:hypothetical protein